MKVLDTSRHEKASNMTGKDSVEDFNLQARIYCRVIPWEGSVWL